MYDTDGDRAAFLSAYDCPITSLAANAPTRSMAADMDIAFLEL
jgi:hypothetical protein